MSAFDPRRRRCVMVALGFVAIAVVSFVGGWLVGTALKPWWGSAKEGRPEVVRPR
jgi:hypothetical protein